MQAIECRWEFMSCSFFAFSALAVDKCWWCRLYSHAKMDAKIFWTGRGARLVLPYTKYSIRQSLYHRTPILQKAKKKNILLYILFDHINIARRVEYPKKSSFQFFCAKVESFKFCNVQENGPRPFGVWWSIYSDKPSWWNLKFWSSTHNRHCNFWIWKCKIWLFAKSSKISLIC